MILDDVSHHPIDNRQHIILFFDDRRASKNATTYLTRTTNSKLEFECRRRLHGWPLSRVEEYRTDY
jgi:hypothetical protein